MIAVLILLSIIAQVAQQAFRKEYDKRGNQGAYCFSFFGVISTLIYFFLMNGGRFAPDKLVLSFSLPFSICYTAAYVCTMYAIRSGPLSLTSMIISCSIAVPVVFGIVFLIEPCNLLLIIGGIMFLISVILVSQPWSREESGISVKWIIYSAVTFFSNGACLVLQKLFQIKDKGAHSNEFMICSLMVTAFVLLILVIIRERNELKELLGGNIIWPVMVGAGNGIANQVTMQLAIVLPASFLYPVQSAGAMVLTAVVSVLIYREKLSFAQKAGFVAGVVAIISFNM